MKLTLIDTHTHFDVPEYDGSRVDMAQLAYQKGVKHLILIGLLAKYFDQMVQVNHQINAMAAAPRSHFAFGLHPLYIQEQKHKDLEILEEFIKNHQPIAIGEIGMDTYPSELKEPKIFAKQELFFAEQVKLAKMYELPILLHIRKTHSDVLRVLERYRYNAHELGGIAHSFSGGEQEALAFVKRGFKLGITGQVTNPNAKKLHCSIRAVYDKFGADAFVIETDCPDMMPLPCQHLGSINEPANLPYVLEGLAGLLGLDKYELAEKLWRNSCDALRVDWRYE